MKPSVYWVLLANSASASIYEVKLGFITRLHHFDFAERRQKTHDIVSNKQGHSFPRMGAMGGGGHMVGSDEGLRHHEENVFAHELIETCVKGKAEHKFDNIVIIAAPHFLGELRHVMKLKSHHLPVEKEIAKDLPDALTDAEKIAHIRTYMGI